jgi:hydrogenase maturation protease
MDEMSKNCVILGIGNVLMRDDGVGVHVVRRLRERVPEGVELVEGGVYAPDLLVFLENRRKAVFIDGVDVGEEPGAVFRFPARKVGRKLSSPPISLHDYGVYDLITAAELLGQCPEEVVIIAVQVKSLDTGTELSEEVERAVPRVCELVMEEIEKGEGD